MRLVPLIATAILYPLTLLMKVLPYHGRRRD